MRFTPLLLVLALIVEPSWPQAQESETAKVVRFVAALESDPLGAESAEKREWLLSWVTETPDYTVVLCDVLGPIPKTDVPHGRELLLQYMFGNVAYQIQNGKGDGVLPQVAGVESLLHAYSAIVEQKPDGHIPYFDELLALQRQGNLVERMIPLAAAKCTDTTQA